MNKEPIRILHVLQRMEAGGTQALLMNIYRNIDRSKVQFDFLVEYTDKEFYDDEILSLGGKIYYTNLRKDKNILKFEKYLKRIIKENNYKVIHVHTYSIGYFVLKTAKKCGVPVRIAHSHNNQTIKDGKYIIKLIMQKLYTIHATDLFACSLEAGQYLFRKKEFKVLNNSINSESFIFNNIYRKEILNEFKFSEDDYIVIHVGRFHEQKNHEFLLKIFLSIKEKKKNSKLLLVGNGPLKYKIEKKIHEYGIEDSVFILGNRSDINKLMMASDIFVFPSLFEGLGIVAVEAQASGTPVVCSNRLPDEVMITPIIKKLSLDDDADLWSETAIELSNSQFKHKDLSSYVLNNNYDVKESAKDMEKFYIKKYDEGVIHE